jgi:hypothetical protein
VSSERLEKLLQLLSNDSGSFRVEIDTYLLASYYKSGVLDSNLVLNVVDSYHYHNLPNFLPFLIRNLARGTWHNSLLSGLLSMFCLQVKKLKKTSRNDSIQEKCAVVNMMHGTLLGLYPFNLKVNDFATRSKVAGKIHMVLTSGNVDSFIKSYNPLIQFCIIEYLTNIISDFCPVEEALLFKNLNAKFNLNQIFESMRMQIPQYVDSDSFFGDLNAKAIDFLPGMFRQTKLMCNKIYKKASCVRNNFKFISALDDADVFQQIMSHPKIMFVQENLIGHAKLIFTDWNFDTLQAVEYLWKNVNVHKLPESVTRLQCQNIEKFRSRHSLHSAIQIINVCLLCALKSKHTVFQQKFAFNCLTGKLHCASCSKEASKINLLGRVLIIKNVSYLLCCKCLQVHIWNSQDYMECESCKLTVDAIDVKHCIACARKTHEILDNIMDVQKMKLCSVPLCFQHSRHRLHYERGIYDIPMLLKELSRVNCSSIRI